MRGTGSFRGYLYQFLVTLQHTLPGVPRGLLSDCFDEEQVWKFSSNGQYSTLQAYELACGRNPGVRSDGWRWTWKSKEQSRIQFFIWLTAGGRIPTATMLPDRGINVPVICRLCSNDEEDAEHVLRGCPIARRVCSVAISENGFGKTIKV